jgi:hypothetical protein
MVYKVIYELGKINYVMGLSIGILYESVKELNNFGEIVYTYGGTNSMTTTIHPTPFIVVSFGQKNASFEEKRRASITLNKYGRFSLVQALKKMDKVFRDNANLFYYYNGELKLNPNIANNSRMQIKVNNNSILLYPALVIDNTNVYHEGIIFAVNSDDNYCQLTFAEMEYLLYTLDKIDMDLLGLKLLEYIEMTKNTKPDNLDNEITQKDMNDVKIARLEKPNTLPDI